MTIDPSGRSEVMIELTTPTTWACAEYALPVQNTKICIFERLYVAELSFEPVRYVIICLDSNP